MRNTQEIVKVDINVKILWKGQSIDLSKELPPGNFLKGGVAREALMAYARGEEKIIIEPRDIDLWIGTGGGIVDEWIDEGEDWRDILDWVGVDTPVEEWASTLLSMKQVDVDINLALVGAEGLYFHVDALKAVRAGVVSRVDNYLPDKRGIRAHFFALRYNMVAVNSPLPLKHPYLEVTRLKAQQLGIEKQWEEYLSSQDRWSWEEEGVEEEIEVIIVDDDE